MPTTPVPSSRRRFLRQPFGNVVPFDLTPMIDCIFLLLIFFILTSRFEAEDLQIAALMPTDRGQPIDRPSQLIPPPRIAIAIYPAGLEPGHQPSEYGRRLAALRADGGVGMVAMRIGGDEPLLVDGSRLDRDDLAPREVERVHAHLRAALSRRESGAAGEAAPPITIHCFSGLPWKFALLAYDAVRDYERSAGRGRAPSVAAGPRAARAVDFAPPRVRNYRVGEIGEELCEIVNVR